MYVHVGVHRGTCYTCTYYVPQRGGRTEIYELCGLLVTDKNVYRVHILCITMSDDMYVGFNSSIRTFHKHRIG